ncbi:MAG: hypothetical protein EOO54_10935 [Haliea sp.]|nr:MAG: hypothetical protein EOO54_10935 [Haliea sp.]
MASTSRPDIRSDIHHGHQLRMQRDSRPWQLQVWISFLLAALLCAVGLAWLPGRDLDRAFMVMGYLFCLTAAFVLAKYIRDQQQEAAGDTDGRTERAISGAANTPMFGLVVWGGFFLAMSLTAWGLWRMEVNPTWKAYLGVSWLYLITCTFTLAKMVRDKYQADLLDAHAPGRATAADHTAAQ